MRPIPAAFCGVARQLCQFCHPSLHICLSSAGLMRIGPAMSTPTLFTNANPLAISRAIAKNMFYSVYGK